MVLGRGEAIGHMSDCAVHNAPAYPKGECDCHLDRRYYMAYTGEDWRSPKWVQAKREILARLYNSMDDHVEELVNRALGDYMDSDEFCNDAQEYCTKELGWHRED